MPLERFHVQLSNPTASDAELLCGFYWLLSRSETELHIAGNRSQSLTDALKKIRDLHASLPGIQQIANELLKSGGATLGNQRITTGTFHPQCQARPNGACLVIWGDDKQAASAEAKLGPVGAICVLPWTAQDIAGWVNSHGVPTIDCTQLLTAVLGSPSQSDSTPQD